MMSSPHRRRRKARRPAGRLRPAVDRLESRLARSGLVAGAAPSLPAGDGTLMMTLVTPAPQSLVDGSLTTLSVGLDRPIDPFTVGLTDFDLVHVAGDGTTTPLGPGEATVAEAIDPTDGANDRITMGLSQPLRDGHYELLLDAGNELRGVDGSVTTSGGGLVLGDFTVARPGVGLSSATDLGTAGPDESVHSDRLDLASDPDAVKLYKVTLEPGHFWSLGLEISAHRDGGSLSSVLSLFDSKGALIKTASQGMTSDSLDPYLFAGLAPGTYYVGVSGSGNIPGTADGYDPSKASPGLSPSVQGGGPFRLHIVADPADQAVRVADVRLDHADPEDPAPTGLTVKFSGAIDETSMTDPTRPIAVLVDSQGQTWSLTPSVYDARHATLSFLFNQGLPAGHYQLQLAKGSPMVDLAGLSPVADGQPSGVLGSFVAVAGDRPASDLGVLFPDQAATGLTGSADVAAGNSQVETVTVVEAGIYQIQANGDPVQMRLLDADGVVSAAPSGSPSGSIAEEVSLGPGQYTVLLSNPGSSPAHVVFSIHDAGSMASSLVETGVGQGPALGLRLIAPSIETQARSSGATASGSASGPLPQTIQGASATGTVLADSSARGSSNGGSAAAMVAENVVFGPFVGIGSPIGHPSADSEAVAVVGPSGSSGMIALASGARGLQFGLIAPVPNSADYEPGSSEIPGGVARPGKPSTTVVDAAVGSIDSPMVAGADFDIFQEFMDDFDWLGPVKSWFQRRTDVAAEVNSTGPETAPRMEFVNAPSTDAGPFEETRRVESASFAPSVGFVSVAVAAFRYRRALFGWLRRPDFKRESVQTRAILAGPHRRPRTRFVR